MLCFMILQVPFHQHTVEELIIGVEYPAKVCISSNVLVITMCLGKVVGLVCRNFLVASKRFTQTASWIL